MKRLSMVLVAAVLAGCGDRSLTGIESGPAPRGASHSVIEPADVRSAIDDALDRLVPGLSDEAAGRQVGAALRGLQQALASGRAADNSGAVDAAQAAVERYASLGTDDAAEVDAIRLAIATVIGSH